MVDIVAAPPHLVRQFGVSGCVKQAYAVNRTSGSFAVRGYLIVCSVLVLVGFYTLVASFVSDEDEQ